MTPDDKVGCGSIWGLAIFFALVLYFLLTHTHF